MQINLPETPEEAHEALGMALAKMVQADNAETMQQWINNYEALQEAAHAKWPDGGFEPYEPCPICDDLKGVPCERCDKPSPTEVSR